MLPSNPQQKTDSFSGSSWKNFDTSRTRNLSRIRRKNTEAVTKEIPMIQGKNIEHVELIDRDLISRSTRAVDNVFRATDHKVADLMVTAAKTTTTIARGLDGMNDFVHCLRQPKQNPPPFFSWKNFSQFVGKIGDRIARIIEIDKAIAFLWITAVINRTNYHVLNEAAYSLYLEQIIVLLILCKVLYNLGVSFTNATRNGI